MRTIAALVSAAGLLSAAIIGPAFAQKAEGPLKIGLLTTSLPFIPTSEVSGISKPPRWRSRTLAV